MCVGGGGVSGGVGRELLFLCLLFKVCAPHHCRVFAFDVLQLNTQIRQGTGLHYSNSYHLSMRPLLLLEGRGECVCVCVKVGRGGGGGGRDTHREMGDLVLEAAVTSTSYGNERQESLTHKQG